LPAFRLPLVASGILLFWLGTLRLDAVELMSTARQMGHGSLKAAFFYSSVEDQDLEFAVSSADQIQSMSGADFFSRADSHLPVEGNGDGLFLKLTYQPWENSQYYALVGSGHYTVLIPSVTVANTLSGSRLGWTWGLGWKTVIIPDTVVTPAVSVDASLQRSRFFLNRFGQDGLSGDSVDERLDLYQYQVAVEAGHQWPHVEPYGGVKWNRNQIHLKDSMTGRCVGGYKDKLSPFFGVRLPVYPQESFLLEASFADGVHIGVGWEIRFN